MTSLRMFRLDFVSRWLLPQSTSTFLAQVDAISTLRHAQEHLYQYGLGTDLEEVCARNILAHALDDVFAEALKGRAA